MYRYGPTGTIYWCRKLKGRNVWKNLQTTDRQRAIAMTAIYNYAASQNGNHDLSVMIGAETLHLPCPRQQEALVMPIPPIPTQKAPSRPPAPNPAPGITLQRLAERFRTESKHLSESTRKTIDYLFQMARKHLSFERDARDIRLADLRDLKSRLSEGHKASSVNDVLFKGLVALFTLALEDGYIKDSPLERFKRARKTEPLRQQPTWEQSLQILDAGDRFVTGD